MGATEKPVVKSDPVAYQLKPVEHKGTREQWLTTCTIYYCHVALGVAATFTAPALISFAEQYSTDMKSMSVVIMISRYLSLASCLAFGYIYRYVNRHALVIAQVFIMAATLLALPYSGSLTVFGILFSLIDIAGVGYATATAVWVIDIWSDQAGPFIQGQHFCFALGTIIPPTVLAPFLDKQDSPNRERGINATSLADPVDHPEVAVDHMAGVYIPSIICGVITAAGAVLMCVILVMFREPKYYAAARTEEHAAREAGKDTEKDLNIAEEGPNNGKWRKITVITLGSLLVGAIQSMEMIVTNFLPTYA